jgi:16S rRNA (guanine527-N7)-methyltransferase
VEKFSREYYKLLTKEYAGINLTRINEYNEFEAKQIVDSVKPYEESTIFKDLLNSHKLMIDIGFGGGFPILPMANLLPDIQFVGVETRNKKCKVVGEMAEKLGLKNTKFVHSRLENFFIDKECVCTLKAVGKVYDFLSKISTDKIITVFFYKGPNFYELEKDQLEKVKKDWKIIEEREIDVPGTDKRIFIGFRNKNVLHGTFDIKQLVKLSSIL